MCLSGALTWNILKMHRFSTTLLGLGASFALACGAPAELDESQFPELGQTGYADDDPGSGGTLSAPVGGTGVTGLPGAGGAGGLATGGTQQMQPAGTSGAPPIASGGTESGMGGDTTGGGCPDDITVLFNRPIEQGGCAGAACHVPNATRPDLVSPGVEERLLNVQSSCNGLPYIGNSLEQSFLAIKVQTPPRECGVAMPFFQPNALSADDEACILSWIAEVSGG